MEGKKREKAKSGVSVSQSSAGFIFVHQVRMCHGSNSPFTFSLFLNNSCPWICPRFYIGVFENFLSFFSSLIAMRSLILL